MLLEYLSNSKNKYDKILLKIINLIIKNGIPNYLNKFIENLKKIKFENNINNDKNFLKVSTKLIKLYHYHSSINISFKFNSTHADKLIPTKFSIINNIGIIKLYIFDTYSLKKSQINDYIKNITDFLDQNKNMKGLILDFRKHTGGSIWPLIEALSRFLNNNTLFAWDNNKVNFNQKKWVNLVNNTPKYNQHFIKSNINTTYPIAIIIGNKTASAGEFVASCFTSDKNVKFFGQRTAGYLSVNNTYNVDKYEIHFPIALQTSKNGNFQEYLEPNVYTNKPITDAKKWIMNQFHSYEES
jgi:C-terminal processing protease CtpA/Prc